MKKTLITAISCLTLSLSAAPLLAEEIDADLCLDCHEPAEDWEGMSVDEIMAKAVSPDISRHAGNEEASEEQLRQIIGELLAQ
jgi:hypothetical protein